MHDSRAKSRPPPLSALHKLDTYKIKACRDEFRPIKGSQGGWDERDMNSSATGSFSGGNVRPPRWGQQGEQGSGSAPQGDGAVRGSRSSPRAFKPAGKQGWRCQREQRACRLQGSVHLNVLLGLGPAAVPVLEHLHHHKGGQCYQQQWAAPPIPVP